MEILVVNKMRRCAKGNSQEAQNVIREDLRKVLAPFNPEDLRTTFIDAEAALESKTETEGEIAKILLKKSGVDGFTQELNRFVREKGLSSRYTTAFIALSRFSKHLPVESTGDKDIDALEELLLQRRRALLDTQDCIPTGGGRRNSKREFTNPAGRTKSRGHDQWFCRSEAVDQGYKPPRIAFKTLLSSEKSVQVVIAST